MRVTADTEAPAASASGMQQRPCAAGIVNEAFKVVSAEGYTDCMRSAMLEDSSDTDTGPEPHRLLAISVVRLAAEL